MGNKHRNRFKRHHQLYLFQCIGDCSEWDTLQGFTAIARDKAHAIELLTQGCLEHGKRVYTLTKEDILERVEEALAFGHPLPETWKQYIPEVVANNHVWNDPANWVFKKLCPVPQGTRPQIATIDFKNG